MSSLSLDRVLSSPLPRCSLVSGSVGLVDVGNLGNQRIVRVGVCKHRADGQENYRRSAKSEIIMLNLALTFRDGQSRAPLITQNVEADTAIRVDVGVIDAGGEVDLWGLEGVVGRKVD